MFLLPVQRHMDLLAWPINAIRLHHHQRRRPLSLPAYFICSNHPQCLPKLGTTMISTIIRYSKKSTLNDLLSGCFVSYTSHKSQDTFMFPMALHPFIYASCSHNIVFTAMAGFCPFQYPSDPHRHYQHSNIKPISASYLNRIYLFDYSLALHCWVSVMNSISSDLSFLYASWTISLISHFPTFFISLLTRHV